MNQRELSVQMLNAAASARFIAVLVSACLIAQAAVCHNLTTGASVNFGGNRIYISREFYKEQALCEPLVSPFNPGLSPRPFLRLFHLAGAILGFILIRHIGPRFNWGRRIFAGSTRPVGSRHAKANLSRRSVTIAISTIALGIIGYVNFFSKRKPNPLPSASPQNTTTLGALYALIDQLDTLVSEPNQVTIFTLQQLQTSAYWRAKGAPIPEDTANAFRNVYARVIERSHEVHWDLFSATPLQRIRLVRRQTRAIVWITLLSLPDNPAVNKEDAVLRGVLPIIFEEQLEMAGWLNNLHAEQLKSALPLSLPPAGLFIEKPSVGGPSIGEAMNVLPSPLQSLAGPVQNLLTALPSIYGSQEPFNIRVFQAFNEALYGLKYALHYRLDSPPMGSTLLNTWLYRLKETGNYRIGQGQGQGILGEPLWHIGVSENLVLEGFEINISGQKVVIDEKDSLQSAKAIWAIRQATRSDHAPVENLPFWHPGIKALVDRSFAQKTFKSFLAAYHHYLFTHEFLHRWFRLHSHIEQDSNLFRYFKTVLPQTDPTQMIFEYAAHIGTVALSEAAPWDLKGWVDMLSTSMDAVGHRLIHDLALELFISHPGLFKGVLTPTMLTRADGIRFLLEINKLSIQEIHNAARKVYERNFGELMPLPVLENPVPARAALFGWLRELNKSSRYSHSAPVQMRASA